jgi:hypothetical protein
MSDADMLYALSVWLSRSVKRRTESWQCVWQRIHHHRRTDQILSGTRRADRVLPPLVQGTVVITQPQTSSSFFALDRLLGFLSHAQFILQSPYNFHCKATERCIRRVWPRSQSRFRTRHCHRPCEEGQDSGKDPYSHSELPKNKTTRPCRTRRRATHPRRQLFPSQPRPTRVRPCHSVGLRTGCVPYLFIILL